MFSWIGNTVSDGWTAIWNVPRKRITHVVNASDSILWVRWTHWWHHICYIQITINSFQQITNINLGCCIDENLQLQRLLQGCQHFGCGARRLECDTHQSAIRGAYRAWRWWHRLSDCHRNVSHFYSQFIRDLSPRKNWLFLRLVPFLALTVSDIM